MNEPPTRRPTSFVVASLAVALLIGMVVSYFASSAPDALQRAVIDVACEHAGDTEACLARQEGAPVLNLFPGSLSGYQVGWLSGLIGVLVTLAIGAGLAYVVRWGGRRGGAGNSMTQR